MEADLAKIQKIRNDNGGPLAYLQKNPFAVKARHGEALEDRMRTDNKILRQWQREIRAISLRFKTPFSLMITA